jgi:tetratricopeptide (TPR) repeat protein
VAEAVALLRQGWDKHPGDFWINFELAAALSELKEPPSGEVVRFYTAALAVRPGSAVTYYNLGIALKAQRDLKGAVAAYQQAIRLNPKDAPAYYNLGIALKAQQDLKGAVAAYQQAIQLNPKLAPAYNNLGTALKAQRDLKGAVAAYQKAIQLNPKDAEAYYNLGLARKAQGRFSDARAAVRKAHELFTQQKNPSDAADAARMARQLEKWAALEAKLPALFRGEFKPKDNGERLALLEVCQAKRLHAAAARLAAEAFTADSKIADDLKTLYRYNAACSAALAAAGQGEDAATLDAKERARLRKQALDWLRADLALRGKQLKSGKAEERKTAQQKLHHWKKDTDLAGVRDRQALAKLPAEEGKAWQKLWQEVDALLRPSR